MSFKTFPTIYKKNSKGDKILTYSVTVEGDEEEAKVTSTAGDLSGGKDRVNVKKILKNKQNNAFDRASKLTTTQLVKKCRTGYHDSVEAATEASVPLTAMLASTLPPEDIMSIPQGDFPLYISQKYNGLRGTYHQSTNKSMTRELKEHDKFSDTDGLHRELREMCTIAGCDFLDYELFAPGGYPINEQVSMVRNGDDRIMAYIFDVPTEDAIPFKTRLETMFVVKNFIRNCKGQFPHLFLVEQWVAKCPADIKEFYDRVIKPKAEGGEDAEGIMVRTAHGLYKWNNKNTRGDELQKVKPMLSAEFKVIGIGCEHRIIDGESVELIDFLCETDTGETFKVSPSNFGVEKRKEMYTQFRRKKLTVEDLPLLSCDFREYTTKGKPFHIKFAYFRDAM